MRLTAAAETWSSAPAPAKLPLRAAASNALMPLRNSSRRTSPSGKLMPDQDNSVCAGGTSRAKINPGDSNDAADDCRAWPADGRHRVPVRAVRHGGRADPDRGAADPDAVAGGD